jgi:hypothetical protein
MQLQLCTAELETTAWTATVQNGMADCSSMKTESQISVKEKLII